MGTWQVSTRFRLEMPIYLWDTLSRHAGVCVYTPKRAEVYNCGTGVGTDPFLWYQRRCL